MQYDVERAKRLGANGVVIGILKPDGSIDQDRTAALIASARPLSVTFHRAFDMSRDPFEAMEMLIQLGADRILTSGQEASVLEGLELITELIQQAGDRIIIMPGGGITPRNIRKIIGQSRAKEIHVASMASVDSPMQYRNPRVFMGGELRAPEYSQMITTAENVKTLIDAIY
jgi:copper homeostasis protein